MATQLIYPVRVDARLEEGLSRWLWLVKWLLVIPHYFVLAFLWTAFVLLSVLAFFSILFTGRYPRGIFEFNVGVLRWSWRVAYYSYGALATDRYPPFSLREEPDYPVHLEIDYPEKLSRGLVLIKWWLLAIPHYIIVGLLMGGAVVTVRGDNWQLAGIGLIGILTLVAGVILTFTGSYPRSLFDLLLGFNRWVIRVAAYAGLMTDAYPPFRLDTGGHEPGASISLPVDTLTTPSSPARGVERRGWSAASITSVVFGSLFTLSSVGLLAAGGVALWADQTQREGGFVTSPALEFDSNSYAIVTDAIEIYAEGPDWVLPEAILGDARLRVTGDDELFVGVARTRDVQRYLADVSYAVLPGMIRRDGHALPARSGGAPIEEPGAKDFWIASDEGSGTRTITWATRNGSWSMVVMNADASRGVAFEGDVGAEAPILGGIAIGLLVVGGVLLLIGIVLIGAAIARADRPVEVRTE